MVERESSFHRDAPSANRGAPETSPLVVGFAAVIQAFPDWAKHSCSDGVANLVRRASVLGGRLRVQSDVIDVSLPAADDWSRNGHIKTTVIVTAVTFWF